MPPKAATSNANSAYLLSPKTDWLTLGGLSVLVLPFFFLLPNNPNLATQIGWVLYAVAFVVNYPHFTVSYQLLYGDYRHLLFTDYRFIWAGIIVPILMVLYITWAHFAQSAELLAYFVEFMFVIVGWHYTKQAYGAVVVTSTMKKYYYSKLELFVLKFNMYALWITSLVSFNIGTHEGLEYWGVPYYSLNLPKEALYLGYVLTGISLLVGGIIMLRRIITTKEWPPFVSIISFLAIYAWFLPVIYHPIFFLAVPFFHSIQYFTFVIALKKNEIEDQTKDANSGVKVAIGYIALAIFSGAVLFEAIPRILDVAVTYNHVKFGDGLFLFLFSVFLNIHHYFIDNVIWRKDNETVQKYLFTASNK